MNIISKVNVVFNFSVTHGFLLFSQVLNTLPKFLPTCSQFFLERKTFLFFLCGFSKSVFINSTTSVETLKMFYRTQVG